jgi:outer membrane protein
MTKKIIFLGFCLLSFIIRAQHSFSLEEAQNIGLENNLEIQNAYLNVKHASKQMLETVSVGLPQIHAEAQWQNFPEVPTSLVPASQFDPSAPDDVYTEMQFGIPHTTSGSITASQLIFSGSYIVGLKAAKSFMKFAEISKDLTEKQIKDSITTAYFNVLITKENYTFLKNIVEVHKDIVTETEERYSNGFLEDIEVDRMTMVLSTMEMQLNNVQRQTEIAEAYLKLIIGLPLSESITLTESLQSILDASVSFNLGKSQIKNRLEYQIADLNIELKKLDMRRYQTEKLPSISAFASTGSSAMGSDFNAFEKEAKWYPNQLIGLKITFPIFDGLGGTARIQKARIKYEQAKNEKELISQSLELAHLAAQSHYLNAINNFKHQQSNLILAEKIYTKTTTKYKEGLVSSIELSQTGTEYLETSTHFSKSIHNLLISNLNYQRSLGK